MPISFSQTRTDDGAVVLAIAGELDIATVPAARERLGAAAATGAPRLVVDLRAVTFLDSTALAAFIRTNARLGDRCRMTLVIAPDSYARLIFEVVGLGGVLDIAETVDEALAASPAS